jgi:hypothetical protein
MALLQALISFISRSAGKILNAIFGWAVVALFGRSSPKKQMVLTVVVAMAALWPLLLVGVIAPRISTLVLAFVPIPESVPSWAIRLVWIGLALAVPLIVGAAVAANAPGDDLPEPALKKLARGFSITLGIAAAFLLMFVTVPVLRVISILRGRKDEHVPLITEGGEYQRAAEDIDRIVARHGVAVHRSQPSWWLQGPSSVLRRLGGKALRGFMPARLAYWTGEHLEIALYPSDILIRGEKRLLALTHGILAEAFADGPGVMTYDPRAQELERQIQDVWAVLRDNPRHHVDSAALLARLDDIARELGRIELDSDEWQIVYRKAVQLGRALRGEPQLLAATLPRREEPEMKQPMEAAGVTRPLAEAPTTELVAHLVKQSGELVKKEVELAKAEIKSDVKRQIAMAKGVGIAGVAALCGLNLLLVAAAFALALIMPGWAAALLVAGVLLAVAAVAFAIGWSKRVKKPLAKTQQTIKEDVRWAKQQIA